MSLPLPGRKFNTPSGSPAFSKISTTFAATTGVSLEGLSTTEFPVTTAAAVMPVRIATGKFHGAITATTP